MSWASKFSIDVKQTFPRLAQAPIIEAVIEIRAQAEAPWEEPAITEQLKTMLPDYPSVQSQQQFLHEVKLEPGQKSEGVIQNLGWKGLRFESADKLHIAQFNRDGFLFSHLLPYDSWEQFCSEGLRLWLLHVALAKPVEIQRLGLRFINRMMLSMEREQLEDYLQILPENPLGLDLPLAGFFHNEVLEVPGYPYAINIRRMIQPPDAHPDKEMGIILDIDVCTIQPFELQNGILERYLDEMRWLKNKVFYGSITPRAVEKFK